MSVSASPLHFLLFTCAGWIIRHQQTVSAYLQEENRILKEQLRWKRLRHTDVQRRKLAVQGKALGRKVLGEFASIVAPDTILAGQSYTSSRPHLHDAGGSQSDRLRREQW